MTLSQKNQQDVIDELIQHHGNACQAQIEKGVRQVALRWRDSDGSQEDFRQFCLENFISKEDERTVLFNRFLTNLESLFGNLHRIYRDFNWHLHVDTGKLYSFDRLFATYDVFAHITDDFFRTKLAFVALLNFPVETRDKKVREGARWSRKTWSEIRLAESFADRIPADVKQRRTTAYVKAEEYVYGYNIYMHNVFSQEGKRLFPKGLRLISHWDLRDEIKARYADPKGLEHQAILYTIMERIVAQTIPRQVINNPEVDWNPFTNQLFEHNSHRKLIPEAEATQRYERLRDVFLAERQVDEHTPDYPSLIRRRFDQDREIAEQDVEELMISVLTAPVLKDIAELIEKRLERPLRPFDIWYTGFKEGSGYPEEELDRIVRETYPTLKDFQAKLPQLLIRLGFSAEKAEYLCRYIQVDPARGAGHAMGAKMRGDRAHLRTRVPAEGLNYKGFNTAMHELGHSVEQVFSMNDIDYYTLEGVPNTAFTEAFAFVFQSRDLEVLGLTKPGAESYDLTALHNAWQTMEIAGVSLLDMRIWRWMYEHPGADASQLKEATITLAREIWNAFFAPIFGITDQFHLAIYSHIIYCGLYTPDYTLGHIIAYQIEDHLRRNPFADEVERMCKLGRLAPQVWMQEAVGSPISARPLLTAAEYALQHLHSETV